MPSFQKLSFLFFLTLAQIHLNKMLEECYESAEVNDQAGDQAGDLRAVDLQIHVAAAKVDVLDKECGEDRTDGAQTAQECHGDAVEAHSGHRRNGGLPLFDTGI